MRRRPATAVALTLLASMAALASGAEAEKKRTVIACAVGYYSA
jgi:hypothetical protein